MAGKIFRKAVKDETGLTWEEWLSELDRETEATWSHEQIAGYIAEAHQILPKWKEIIAIMYEQKLGRKPVGQTAEAGVQIGVRRTLPFSKEQAWTFLTSPEGVQLWIGIVPSFELQVGYKFMSEQGTFGQLKVIVPYQKLRMTWQRREWDNPSTLQMYLLAASSGKTTFSFHQEKLDDIYMRETMKEHWEQVLDTIGRKAAGGQT